MNLAGVYHRPESEFAYLYQQQQVHLRIRTAKNDVAAVRVHAVDPYLFHQPDAFQILEMQRIAKGVCHDYWQVSLIMPFQRLMYYFELEDEESTYYYGERGFFTKEMFVNPSDYFRLPYLHEIDRVDAPEWVKETIWYQIFPERFANGDSSISPKDSLAWEDGPVLSTNNFYGGDLRGLIDHLDDLSALGINGIYLCPIFESPSNHKYDTINYYEIDPHFGTKETFAELVDAAHKRGIRIMLDAVFNHIGLHSPQWQDVLKNGPESQYYDWFHIQRWPMDAVFNLDDPAYHTFAFVERMPKLNTANPEVADYLIDIAKYWVEQFDIDGWRLDVANEIDHAFWKRFRREVLAVKSDVFILGEIWHNSQSWLHGDELDSVMNYAYTDHIKEYFIDQSISTTELVERLADYEMLYRRQTVEVMFNLLDSHDTQRVMTAAQGNIAAVQSAFAFLFLMTGSPCIYYGTEIGLEGAHDPDCRRVMLWDRVVQKGELYQWFVALIQLRKDYQSTITYQAPHIDWDDTQLVVRFDKVDENNHQLVAVWNRSDNQSLEIKDAAQTLISHQVVSETTVMPQGCLIYLRKT
ncbi:alpha-glycosidase [Tuanshanicoccus lijuaniae]|uniref:glycoside hydrolase family 13 protein n=1 Tax=Aerococcaceae bacterium zg-1292 TaxID=2774330 RepID=UPI0019362BB1|nr:alpha-glycosidase [Aerococcaceae bacterium zg-1292]QQA36455.1 alpha-glycosidase [Aerococcaceae bacterium zg-1292]